MENPFPHFNLFPRLSRIARFLGAQTVRDCQSDHYRPRGASELLDSDLESGVGHGVAFGYITPEEAVTETIEQILDRINNRFGVHPAEELNGYAEVSDELRYGVEDGQ